MVIAMLRVTNIASLDAKDLCPDDVALIRDIESETEEAALRPVTVRT